MTNSMVSAAGDQQPHLLVYPFSSSGHIIPLLDLTQRLLTRGVTVTVLVTPPNSHLLQPLLSRHPTTLQALVLPAPPAPSSYDHRLLSIIAAMRDHHSPALLQWFAAHPSPPVAIISDFFLGWTHHLARQLGVPRIVFSPSAAAAFSVDFSLWGGGPLRRQDQDREATAAADDNDSEIITLTDVPNSPTFPWWQLSFFYRSFLAGDWAMKIQKDGMVANMESWGVVFNTFAEVERVYLDHMKMRFGAGRVWAVGPLLPSTDDSMDRGGSSSVPPEEVLTWLDSQKDNSVVYVCFGSRMMLTDKEMDALGTALETSGVHFIWCARGHVSDGYENRVRGRGLVIRGWAPQVPILRHRAVGSFLTHCGWNSVLESLSAGVVMLTWPMGADQFTDAKLLVDELGVGIRAWEQPDGIVPDSIDLARVLAHSVSGDIPQRRRAKELSVAANEATNVGGSSDKDLDGFMAALNELNQKKKKKKKTDQHIVKLNG